MTDTRQIGDDLAQRLQVVVVVTFILAAANFRHQRRYVQDDLPLERDDRAHAESEPRQLDLHDKEACDRLRMAGKQASTRQPASQPASDNAHLLSDPSTAPLRLRQPERDSALLPRPLAQPQQRPPNQRTPTDKPADQVKYSTQFNSTQLNSTHFLLVLKPNAHPLEFGGLRARGIALVEHEDALQHEFAQILHCIGTIEWHGMARSNRSSQSKPAVSAASQTKTVGSPAFQLRRANE